MPAKRQGGGDCPDQGPCEASVLASVFCELSTARSEHGAARRPRIGQLRQDPSLIDGCPVTVAKAIRKKSQKLLAILRTVW